MRPIFWMAIGAIIWEICLTLYVNFFWDDPDE